MAKVRPNAVDASGGVFVVPRRGGSTEGPTIKMWPQSYSPLCEPDLLWSWVMTMQLTITEFEELTHMKENIRRSVDALELCWSCQRVSECEPVVVDDSAP